MSCQAVRLHKGFPLVLLVTTHHVTTRTQKVHPNRMAKTILIADDSDVVRRAVCEAFALESDFEVCGKAHDGHDVTCPPEK
jgi:hypothetical protein